MPYKRLSWKFKLFLMVCALVIDLIFLYIKYNEHGYLPHYVIKGVSVSFIFVCLLIVLCDRSLEKYYMNKKKSSNEGDKQ